MLTVVSTTHFDTNRCEAQCLCCGMKCAITHTTTTFVCVECVDKKTRVVTVDLLGQQTIQFVASPIENAESALTCLSKKFSAAIKDASQFALQGFESLNWRIVPRDQGESPHEIQEVQEVELEVSDVIQSPFIDGTAKDNVLTWKKDHIVERHIDPRLLYNALARRKSWFIDEDTYNQVHSSIHNQPEAVFDLISVTVPHRDEQCASTLDYLIKHTQFIRRLTKHLRTYDEDAVLHNVTYNVKLSFLNLNATFKNLNDTNVDVPILDDMLKERADQQMFHNNNLIWEDTIIKLRYLACTKLLPSEMEAARLCGKSPENMDTVTLLKVVSRSNYNTVKETPAGFRRACNNFIHHYQQGSFEDACASRVTRLCEETSQCDPMWYVGSSESWQFVKHYAAYILEKFSGLTEKMTKDGLRHYYNLLKGISAAKTFTAVDACFENFDVQSPTPAPRKAPKVKSKKQKRDRSASPPKKQKPTRVPEEKVAPVTDPVQLKQGLTSIGHAIDSNINALKDGIRAIDGKFAKHTDEEQVNDPYREQYEIRDPEVMARQMLEHEKAKKARDLSSVVVVDPEVQRVIADVKAKEQERLRKEAEEQERKRKEAEEEQERKRKEAEERQQRKADIEAQIAELLQESRRLQEASAFCDMRTLLQTNVSNLEDRKNDYERRKASIRKGVETFKRKLAAELEGDEEYRDEDNVKKFRSQLEKLTAEEDAIDAELNNIYNLCERAAHDLAEHTKHDDICGVIDPMEVKRDQEAVNQKVYELNEQLKQFN